jgi:hypothetical protein
MLLDVLFHYRKGSAGLPLKNVMYSLWQSLQFVHFLNFQVPVNALIVRHYHIEIMHFKKIKNYI